MPLDTDLSDIWDGKQSPSTMSLAYLFRTKLKLGKWDSHKVLKTAEYIGVTLDELCAIAGLFNPGSIARMLRASHWPIGAVLHFERARRVVMSVKLKQPMLPTPADLAIARLLAEKQEIQEISHASSML